MKILRWNDKKILGKNANVWMGTQPTADQVLVGHDFKLLIRGINIKWKCPEIYLMLSQIGKQHFNPKL